MANPERFRNTRSAIFASRAALSLLHNKDGSILEQHRGLYNKMAEIPAREPLNREETLLPQFMQIAEERNLHISKSTALTTYWDKSLQHNPFEVFGMVIQFLGQHNAALPTAILPPENDVQKYIDQINKHKGKVTAPQQFELLLDITDNNVLGAANLGFVASRLMARGDDVRAYPTMKIGEEEMLAWNDKIAQFEVYDNSGKNDGPGDTYYFWTHFFAGLYFALYQRKDGILFEKVFENGTQIMKFVKEKFANKPIISDHFESSELGRHTGFTLAETLLKK